MRGTLSLVLAATLLLAACSKRSSEAPIAVWETDAGSSPHVKLELYSTESRISYDQIEIRAATARRGERLIWLVEPDAQGRPINEVPFADIQKDGSLLIRIVPSLADDSRLAPYRLKKSPNQSQESTPTAGTSASEQPLVPAAGAAHL
jgi:hypothetical protein